MHGDGGLPVIRFESYLDFRINFRTFEIVLLKFYVVFLVTPAKPRLLKGINGSFQT